MDISFELRNKEGDHIRVALSCYDAQTKEHITAVSVISSLLMDVEK